MVFGVARNLVRPYYQNLFRGGVALISQGFYKMGKIMPGCLAILLIYILCAFYDLQVHCKLEPLSHKCFK